jgi:hypothetical protein
MKRTIVVLLGFLAVLAIAFLIFPDGHRRSQQPPLQQPAAAAEAPHALPEMEEQSDKLAAERDRPEQPIRFPERNRSTAV